MKKTILAAVILSAVFIFGCNTVGSSNDPKVVISQFIDALAKKDFVTARKLSTAESKKMLDLMETEMKGKDTKDLEKYDKSRLEFGETRIDGEKATVAVKEKTTGDIINYPLKKENGDWKVAFDKSSILSIGMDKMKEKGMNPMDSLQKGMDEFKKINVDSLKQQMQKGMDVMDSANKN